MPGEYIRLPTPVDGPPPKGWSLVDFPEYEGDGATTLEVVEPLATEMRKLIGRGDVRAARTLLFWFDDRGTA